MNQRPQTTIATAGLVALSAGALAVGRRTATLRGPPPCQHPDCTDDAEPETGHTHCSEHARQFTEVDLE